MPDTTGAEEDYGEDKSIPKPISAEVVQTIFSGKLSGFYPSTSFGQPRKYEKGN